MQGSPEDIPVWGTYEQLDVRYDRDRKALWYHLNPRPRPCFNATILAEVRRFQDRVCQVNRAAGPGADRPVEYLVLGSRYDGVFNLGGDLAMFSRCIRDRDEDALRRYARACIDVMYRTVVGLGQDLTTVVLVQGEALGGGFEAVISNRVVVAERRARFGLPEVLFNLFPGMGAYSYLSRRVSPALAERLILTGTPLTAEEAYEIGLVDVLAEDGEGERAVLEFLARHRRRRNAYSAVARLRDRLHPVTLEELLDVVEVWVETALALTDRDLRMMHRLVRAQDRRLAGDGGAPPGAAARALDAPA